MGKVVEIDCEKSMKLETSRNVTKSKRSLHWCRSISKRYLCTFYYSISQKVITLSGRRFITVSGGFITLSGSYYSIGRFYYIIGQLLQYRAFITLSVGTTVSAAFVAHVDCWLRTVCRVGRLLLSLLPLYSFMHISILLSSSHSCLYHCSPVPTIIRGCLPCRSVYSRHFHVTFSCISVAEIRTAYCARSSDELTIQCLLGCAGSHSVDMGKPSQTQLA